MNTQACCNGCGCNDNQPEDALNQRTSKPLDWPEWNDALPNLPTLEGNK